jgi:hypothetical protein
MAAAKPEVLISRLADQIAARFQRLRPCFRGQAIQVNYCGYCATEPEVENQRWRLLAASKLEVLISQLPDRIATQSQRLPQVFEVQQSNCDIPYIVRCNRKSVIEDGGRQTGSTYISGSRQDSNAISTVTPRFSEFRNQIVIFLILCDASGSQ